MVTRDGVGAPSSRETLCNLWIIARSTCQRILAYLGKESAQLRDLAMFILSVAMQSATCERIFKAFALFPTKARNRMVNKTVHNMVHDLMKKRAEIK